MSYNSGNASDTLRGQSFWADATNIYYVSSGVGMDRTNGDNDALTLTNVDLNFRWFVAKPDFETTVGIAAGGRVTAPHSLSSVYLTSFDLVCLEADAGYNVGDIIMHNNWANDLAGAPADNADVGYVGGYNAADLFVQIGADGIVSTNGTSPSFTPVTLDLTKWRMRMRAWGA
jgi:hypothetical protein